MGHKNYARCIYPCTQRDTEQEAEKDDCRGCWVYGRGGGLRINIGGGMVGVWVRIGVWGCKWWYEGGGVSMYKNTVIPVVLLYLILKFTILIYVYQHCPLSTFINSYLSTRFVNIHHSKIILYEG